MRIFWKSWDNRSQGPTPEFPIQEVWRGDSESSFIRSFSGDADLADLETTTLVIKPVGSQPRFFCLFVFGVSNCRKWKELKFVSEGN